MRQARITRLPSGGALHAAESAGTPLLLLHGVGGGAWSWRPQVDALGDAFRTFAWEARGHGAAARVDDAGLGDYYVDAREALDAVVATAGPAFVVGHSMGGLLAMALAAERPHDVRGLALVDPVYAPDGGGHVHGALGRTVRTLCAPLVRSVARDGRVGRFLARRVFVASFEDRACMEVAWASQRTQVPVEYPKMMYEAFEGPTAFPNRAFAREIVAPTLLLEGSAAQAGPRFARLIDDFAHLGDRFTYRAFSGGHYLQLDRSAARVTRELRTFAERWSP